MNDFLAAVSMVSDPATIVALLGGTLAGIVIGAMPGLSVNMGIALLFPLAFTVKGMGGIIMLLGIYCGAIYGGSISAILLKTPGTPASAATTLDGYPMAMKYKQPGRALGISTTGSMLGGIFSAVCLLIFAPQLAKIALQFSKPEYFALAIFGVSIITSVSSGSVIKGMIGGLIGLFIATIGIDPMSGAMRFTGTSMYLMGGVSFIPILIGLFAFSQVLTTIEEDLGPGHQMHSHVKIDSVLPNWADIKTCWKTVLRSAGIGTFIGCVPGTGGDISSFICYDQAKRWATDKSKFGDGDPRGIAAPETGNNAVSGGAFIPVLTMGIPGDGATAIMLGALMVKGIQPGPLLFIDKAPYVYAIFIGLMAANIVMGLMGYSLIRVFARVVNVPNTVLVPIIAVLTFVGTYSYNNSVTDVIVMAVSGFIGYFLNKTEFSIPAIVIGIILGSLAEQNFTGSLIMSDGSLSIFFTHPICAAFLFIALVSLISPIFKPMLAGLRKAFIH